MGLMDTTEVATGPRIRRDASCVLAKSSGLKDYLPKNIRKRFEKANFSRMEWQTKIVDPQV
jgi:hypothetical protein